MKRGFPRHATFANRGSNTMNEKNVPSVKCAVCKNQVPISDWVEHEKEHFQPSKRKSHRLKKSKLTLPESLTATNAYTTPSPDDPGPSTPLKTEEIVNAVWLEESEPNCSSIDQEYPEIEISADEFITVNLSVTDDLEAKPSRVNLDNARIFVERAHELHESMHYYEDCLAPDQIKSEPPLDLPVEPRNLEDIDFFNASCQTVLQGSDIEQLEVTSQQLLKAWKSLSGKEESRKRSAQKTEVSCMNMTYFKQNPPALRYYTGFPSFTCLLDLYNQVNKLVRVNHPVRSRFELFAMTLQRLRLGFEAEDVAFRYAISPHDARFYTTLWVDAMFQCLRGIVSWPTRDDLQTMLPANLSSEMKDRIAILVDEFEISIHQFGTSAKETKVKYVLVLNHEENVLYVSKALPSVATSAMAGVKEVVDQLKPDDLVVSLSHPSVALFTRVQSSRSTNLDTIHGVEQENGPVKDRRPPSEALEDFVINLRKIAGQLATKFKILQTATPDWLEKDTSGLTRLDKAVTVCSGLSNFSLRALGNAKV